MIFEGRKTNTTAGLAFDTLLLTYHSAVQKVRSSHANAVVAIVMSILQSVVFIAAFYLLFSLIGMSRVAQIRGHFLLYLLTGIFLYLTHVRAVNAMMSAETKTSAIMQLAPMNALIAIFSSALGALYTQTFSLLAILLVVHTFITPVELYFWPGALLMFLLSWASGAVVGLLFASLKLWLPDLIGALQMIYIRSNMIFSGKMFVANSLPSAMLPFFDWNPLFHIIDQCRGFVFVNYFPHNTNWQYPTYFLLVAILLAFMGEHITRKRASLSWGARR